MTLAVTALGNVSGNVTLNLSDTSETYTATLTGNTTLVWGSGLPAAGFSRSIRLILTINGTSTLAFPAGTLYDGGTLPVPSGSGKTDCFEIQFHGSTAEVLVSAKDRKAP